MEMELKGIGLRQVYLLKIPDLMCSCRCLLVAYLIDLLKLGLTGDL